MGDFPAQSGNDSTDQWPGLPPELARHAFDPYVRGAGTSVPGLGLGLATVRRLVEGHNGRYGVTSAPGEGALFWFELPAADLPHPPHEIVEVEPAVTGLDGSGQGNDLHRGWRLRDLTPMRSERCQRQRRPSQPDIADHAANHKTRAEELPPPPFASCLGPVRN